MQWIPQPHVLDRIELGFAEVIDRSVSLRADVAKQPGAVNQPPTRPIKNMRGMHHKGRWAFQFACGPCLISPDTSKKI